MLFQHARTSWKYCLIIFSAVLFIALPVATAYATPTSVVIPASPPQAISHPDQKTKAWRDSKFGMFIHWGLYSIPADRTDRSGNLPKSIAFSEWYYSNKGLKSMDEYKPFMEQFAAPQFDARAWVRAAKDAGMKYIVVTTKHHDGFSMFFTEQSEFNVRNTPFKRDPIQEIAEACEEEGIRFGIYYSLIDWYHDGYYPHTAQDRRCRSETCSKRFVNWALGRSDAQFDHYIDFLKAQLTELLTYYGSISPVTEVWFDGQWLSSAERLQSHSIVRLIRELAPHAMINDRLSMDSDLIKDFLVQLRYMPIHRRVTQNGDFAVQESILPPKGMYSDEKPWESCMTMNDSWGSSKDDHNWKSAQELVRMLITVASQGGNFLLNVGPEASGQFPVETTKRLKEIGAWMKTNGKSIYGTQPCHLDGLNFEGACTYQPETQSYFFHVYKWPGEGIELQGATNKIRWARTLQTKKDLLLREESGAVRIQVPEQIDEIATVVELKFDN